MKKVAENLSYDLSKRLGTGSSGTKVFQGIFNDQMVAVKKMDLDYKEMVDREVFLLDLGKQHENIIKLFCHEETDENYYIALELCHFDSSKYFQQQFDSQPSELLQQLRAEFQVKEISKQTSEGIAFLHKIQIIHRDIKPQNILLKKTEDGWRVKISDFGISKILTSGKSSTLQTLKIHPYVWIAPEVLNKNETSKASDIYSLGCFIYYMQSGGELPTQILKNMNQNFDEEHSNAIQNDFYKTEDGTMCMDLIAEMVITKPKCRIDAEEVLTHGYFSGSTSEMFRNHQILFEQNREPKKMQTMKPIGFNGLNSMMDILVPAETPLPFTFYREFGTWMDNQNAFEVMLYDGEEKKCSDNNLLGVVRIDGIPPNLADQEKCLMKGRGDENGKMVVTLTIKSNGKARTFEFKSTRAIPMLT